MSALAERKQTHTKSLAKPLRNNHFILRCLAFKTANEEYTAECVDLDLMVRGRTANEALSNLKSAVMTYIEVALDGDLSGLVPRPSPLSHRLRYHLYALRAAFCIGTSGRRRSFLLSDCLA